MKNILMLSLIFLISACEFHEQEAFGSQNETSKVFTASAIETLFDTINTNNFFALKTLVEEDNSVVNLTNNSNQSLLIAALDKKQALSVHLLVNSGADVSYKNGDGKTASDVIASFATDEQSDWRAILSGGDIPATILNTKTLELVSETAQDSQDKTWRLLQTYFERGGDVNAKNKRGFNLLAIAVFKPLPQLTQNLCSTPGVDVNARIRRKTILANLKAQMRRRPELVPMYDILSACGGTLR